MRRMVEGAKPGAPRMERSPSTASRSLSPYG